MGNVGTIAINNSLYKKLPYDHETAFAPINFVADLPLVMLAYPGLAAKTPKDIIAMAKAEPGKVTFASSGAGGAPHLAAEIFEDMAGIKMLHVPYKGGGPAIADVVGGQLTLSYTAIAGGSSFVKAGKLKALGVSSLQRSAALPDVPTFIESGLPGFAVESWIALFAPAGTPRPIVDRLQRDVAAVLALPEVRERYAALGLQPGGGAPEQLAAQMKEDYTRWDKVIREAGIKIE